LAWARLIPAVEPADFDGGVDGEVVVALGDGEAESDGDGLSSGEKVGCGDTGVPSGSMSTDPDVADPDVAAGDGSSAPAAIAAVPPTARAATAPAARTIAVRGLIIGSSGTVVVR
jgi:hypothetical protein